MSAQTLQCIIYDKKGGCFMNILKMILKTVFLPVILPFKFVLVLLKQLKRVFSYFRSLPNDVCRVADAVKTEEENRKQKRVFNAYNIIGIDSEEDKKAFRKEMLKQFFVSVILCWLGIATCVTQTNYYNQGLGFFICVIAVLGALQARWKLEMLEKGGDYIYFVDFVRRYVCLK